MTGAIVIFFLAYLLGSVSGSLSLGKLKKVDIRTMGSGNAGGTNALRTQGKWFALGVIVIDIGKGLLAVRLAQDPALFPSFFNAHAVFFDAFYTDLYPLIAGFAVILGHIYPVYHQFKGGKGAATFVGVLIILSPAALVPILSIWLICILITGYVGLSTILAIAYYLPWSIWWGPGDIFQVRLLCSTLSAALIIFAHRANIFRLMAGNENRFKKIMVKYWLAKNIN